MKVVARSEDLAEREIVKVCDVDLVVGLAGGAHARDEIRRDREIEKQVNEVHVAKIRCELADRRLAGALPSCYDLLLAGERNA